MPVNPFFAPRRTTAPTLGPNGAPCAAAATAAAKLQAGVMLRNLPPALAPVHVLQAAQEQGAPLGVGTTGAGWLLGSRDSHRSREPPWKQGPQEQGEELKMEMGKGQGDGEGKGLQGLLSGVGVGVLLGKHLGGWLLRDQIGLKDQISGGRAPGILAPQALDTAASAVLVGQAMEADSLSLGFRFHMARIFPDGG